MICPKCGSKLLNEAESCSLCGYVFSDDTKEVAAVPVNDGGNAASVGKKRKANMPGVISGALFLLSIFLPFATFSIFGAEVRIAMIDGEDCIFYIALAVLAVVFASHFFTKGNVGLIIVGVLAVILAVGEGVHTFHEAEYAAIYSRGIGYILSLVSSAGILGSGIYGLKNSKAS